VWFHSNGTKVEPWTIAPPLLEDIYTFEDALVAGCIMITFHNNCDRVKIACLAQLVNVIAPIMTEKGGPAWVQTIFYPFMLTSKNGRGRVLSAVIDCEKYDAGTMKDIPYIEASVIENDGELTVFAVNRSLEEDMSLELNFENYRGLSLKEHTELYCDDLQAVNTKDSAPVAPVSVPVDGNECSEEGTFKVTLKKHSWNMLKFSGE
ncbi:MAG: alpha-N-arabinofuranosidase, partial [Parasporobacterium sp.]|nr:alpha-N-arabinofuranosidase [Parasporobacterium sp.]